VRVLQGQGDPPQEEALSHTPRPDDDMVGISARIEEVLDESL
jgi:hypothetical protein